MDTKGLQKEFINWCKSKNKQPKSEDETKQLFVAFMKEKHPEEYKQAVQNQQKQQQAQAKKAAHGTKLNYFKSLKNQCAEDEEVVYFKKGGSVKCGCKKKEDGGEIAKAQKGSAVDKFKNRKKEIKQEPPKQDQAARDSIRINSVKGDTELEATRPGNYKPNPKYNPKDPNSRTHTWVPDRTKEPYNKDNKKDKVKKDCGGSAIKKFKMHRQGGSLNRIPFMQNGTPKRGIHLNELEEKQFDPLPPNASREQFVQYYGLPKNFFELDQPIKRKMFQEAYNRVNQPKQKSIIDIIHPESTMQPVIPNIGLGQKTFGTYFKKTLEK